MPTCYTLIGPQGCGKSTWRADKAAGMNNPEVISTDDLVEAIAKQQNKTYAAVFEETNYLELVAKCRAKIVRAVIAGRDIILDQTNYTVDRRMLFRSSIPASYKMVGVVFEYEREELIRRVTERASLTGKHIPLYVIDKVINGMVPPLENEFEQVLTVPMVTLFSGEGATAHIPLPSPTESSR